MKNLNISVLGGGLMGAGIAQIFAASGYDVTVFEPNADVRASLKDRITENLRLAGGDPDAVQCISSTDDMERAVQKSDFVTEAAPEKLELKRSIFADLEKYAPRTCILASNTSVIPITRIVEGLETANRMIGTHWWNPPYLVPLVEVIETQWSDAGIVQTTIELLSHIGKKPAHVKKDTPGFVGNRLQHALWREAIAMIAEGVCDAKTLDDCVKNSFGLRLPVLGPLENADLIGLDLTLDIHTTMMPELDAHLKPNPLLEKKVQDGELGFKTGSGFRAWSADEMQSVREKLVSHLVDATSKRD